MTFLEKVKNEYPSYVGPLYANGVYGCPHDFGLEDRNKARCESMSCSACWNREMPGTVPTPKNGPASDDGAGEADGMTAEREARILEAAINTFGNAAQVDMMIEEMSELTKALLKWRRAAMIDGDNTEEKYNAVLEEMADVQIMLNQMALIFGDSAEYEIANLERLEKRLAETKT